MVTVRALPVWESEYLMLGAPGGDFTLLLSSEEDLELLLARDWELCRLEGVPVLTLPEYFSRSLHSCRELSAVIGTRTWRRIYCHGMLL